MSRALGTEAVAGSGRALSRPGQSNPASAGICELRQNEFPERPELEPARQSVLHGGLAILLVFPFAVRVLGHSTWEIEESVFRLSAAVVLIFFVLASVVRLFFAERWW